ncbi:MAG: IS200/IS605 family transposase [Verrucomicrobia bacterium]|nr:IS200/IS605 family transposase [Verrucomicrobiota bacterium]MBS0638216.1 IS200/IS605 family transposase [Verrucomicrobiota bacterium]
MAQSLCDIILHIVFSTKERQGWILPKIEDELYRFIFAVCRKNGCLPIRINGVEDHVHILLQLGKEIAPSKIISEIKSSSSRWIKTKGKEFAGFTWQSGYGAFSVSRPNIDVVMKYIDSQKEHHETISFQDEFRAMLNRAGIVYDEKYLWD